MADSKPAPEAEPVGATVTPKSDTVPVKDTKHAQSDSDDEPDEVLEESPCGRWQKRKEKVKQRDVPGIDVAYLAMDTETGNEVVWNEVQFSERKNFRAQEENIHAIFQYLTLLEHPNLVKFHKYWTDSKSEKPRIIFITEYMSSGSMSQFLKRTRKGSKTLSEKAWKKWCTQILVALNYLHLCDSPIIHGNLSCNTIFIQQNGLIKIGCVAPNAIHHHVKTFQQQIKNMHYFAPEYEFGATAVTTAADIYCFGICALEMAVLGFAMNGEPGATAITQEFIHQKLESLEDPLQKDFIRGCLDPDPKKRPTAKQLLFHCVLFEVHSLKLLAAHIIVNHKKCMYQNYQYSDARSQSVYESLTEDDVRLKDKDMVIAEVVRPGKEPISFKYSDVSVFEMDKFLEDVRNGIYPLYAFAPHVHAPSVAPQRVTESQSHSQLADATATASGSKTAADLRARSPEGSSSHVVSSGEGLTSTVSPADKGDSVDDTDTNNPANETRKVIKLKADLHQTGVVAVIDEGAPAGSAKLNAWALTLLLKFEDQMNRQLTADIKQNDTAEGLAKELVHHGFICTDDIALLRDNIEKALAKRTTAAAAENTDPTKPAT